MVLAAARAAGATDVVVSDAVDSKLDRAAERGADRTVNVGGTDLKAAVDDYTDGRGVDAVVEASGAAPAVQATLGAVRRGGDVVLVGLPGDGEIPLDVLDMIDNELDVHGSFRFANTYPAAVDLLAAEAVDVAGVVDFEAQLADVDEAFRRARDPRR